MAQSEGVALNQLINVAVAEKLSALRTEDYFSERVARANIPNALKILRRAAVRNPPKTTTNYHPRGSGDKVAGIEFIDENGGGPDT